MDFGDFSVEKNLSLGGVAFGFEHVGYFRGGIVAEELAKGFFAVSDAVFLDQGEKIVRRETGESGFGEVGIRGKEILRRAMNVGEIASASAGDEDLFPDALGVFKDGDAAATLGGLDRAKEAGRASTED